MGEPFSSLPAGDNRSNGRQPFHSVTKEVSVPVMDPVEKLDWQEESACREYDNTLFFGPDQGESELEKQAREARAKAVCQRCPVSEPCLEFAMDTNQKYGIWGGLTDKERASLKRRRARARRAS